MPESFNLPAFLGVALHVGIVAGLSARVLWRRRPIGVALAWIAVLVSFPFVGLFIYLFVGEPWLSARRARRAARAAKVLRRPIADVYRRFGVAPEPEHPAARAIFNLGRTTGMSPPLGGNDAEVIGGAGPFFEHLIRDIDNAKRCCDLLYYIWYPGGRVADVEAALLRAQARGVACRVLVDAVGGKPFLESSGCAQMRKAGIRVRAALAVNPFRGTLQRIDIRNHRKLASIDSRIAYVGSQNMADPAVFRKGDGFGRWIDLSARLVGPGAALLDEVFEIDWAMESEDPSSHDLDAQEIERAGTDTVQVVPSGPGQPSSTLAHILTAAVYGAQKRLIITTPYFIPDEAFASGLVSAAMRGVETTLVVPAKVDGVLVRLASMAYYDELLEAGVRVRLFDKGLLHAKTVTVDDAVGVIGTVNIDRRSFWLNYELSLVVHGEQVVSRLAALQQRYVEGSTPLQDSPWMHRSSARKLVERFAQLFSPIL